MLVVATTVDHAVLFYKEESISLDEAYQANIEVLDKVYPTTQKASTSQMIIKDCHERSALKAKVIVETPKVW